MGLPLSYNWRNLFVRKTTTLLTVLVITAVVAVFAWLMGFATALSRSLSFASDDHKLIVLKPGSTAESTSAITVEDYNKLSQLADVARDATSGEALQSPEMLVQVSLPRVRDGGTTSANVAVRGVTQAAFKVHPNVKLRGAMFSEAVPQVIVGEACAKQFMGLSVGDTINLGYGGARGYKVVGHFSADGGPMESEIWGYLPSLLNSYQRAMYSSVNLRLNEGADIRAVVEQVEGAAIQLSAQTERDYWQEQGGNVRFYLRIAGFLVGVMCLAAVFAIANTMFSSVAGRTREFAMLRTIGFSGRQVLASVVVESVFLALMAGGLGCLACAAWLRLAGATKDMFGATTFTTMAFEIRLSPWIVAAALVLVSMVAVVGSLWPAWRASRLEVVTALREE